MATGVKRLEKVGNPLIVVGANSIAIYVISCTMEQFFSAAFDGLWPVAD